MTPLIPLILDDRERAGPLPAALAQSGVFDIEVRRLAVGDYLVDGRLLFERKTLPDLALSIQDGRLFAQALRLAASPLRAALVIEGTARDLAGSGMRWEAVQGALVAVALFIGLPLLRSRSPTETARTLEFAALQGRAVASGALVRRGRRPRGKAAVQRYVLQGLPGIGPEKAARLLEHFGSVQAVIVADAAALEAVPGIGARTAKRVRWAVEEARAIYAASVSGPATPNTSHNGISMPSRVVKTSFSSAATTAPLS
jgi:ERCC4-type nuclease